MNFYKHHLGDYDGHTAHLSWDEDMAYTRLLRAYYRREAPIALEEAYRLARATSKGQRAAVDSVLREFFSQGEGGWHNKRADEEITAYQAQASTNRRIARERIVTRTVNEPSTKGTPNQIPDTKNQNQEPEKPKAKEEGASRASRLHGDWELPKAWGEWALKEQPTWTEEHVRKVAENFRDHWIATPKGTKLDWFATWRKWVRGDPALKGNGAAVPVPKCARCGATDFASLRQTSEGRLCGACIDRADRVAA